MKIAQFIIENAARITSEWEEFARADGFPDMDRLHRRDHVAGMLNAMAADLETPQTRSEQKEKSKGNSDEDVASDTSSNSHGTDRAAAGYTPGQMVSEFRGLRASILRLWSEGQSQFDPTTLADVTRFNESIDQLLAESISRYTKDVSYSKDVVLGVLGHDLRNPLGAIMTSAQLMMKSEPPEWPQMKMAALIVSSVKRMDQIIGNLVDFTSTRLGNGIAIVPADSDLEAVCRQTVNEIRAFRTGSTVNLDASGDLHGLWDGGRIGQVVSNLVSNAYQHGAKNAPINVTLRGERDDVVLSVNNQGPVIPPNHLKDIFAPFKQLDPESGESKHGNRMGLGLFIVEAIVNAHHGTIQVESTTRGTTFTVRLPRQPKGGSAPSALHV